MLREKLKWRPHKSESTDARHRSGAACISDEGSVMELERRGWLIRLYDWVNQKWEELLNKVRPMVAKLSAGCEEPCESRDSRTDLWGRGGEISLRYPTI
jgi:hypothetical protein